MSVNPNWSRWIFASASKHFADLANGVKFYIEGQPRDTKQTDQEIYEFRQDGPHYTEATRHQWNAYVEINILIQAAKLDDDFHRMRRLAGVIEAAFTDIPVYKYGDTLDDDDSYLGCLKLRQDKRAGERIQTSHFGQIEKDTNLEQAVVEGHFDMELDDRGV